VFFTFFLQTTTLLSNILLEQNQNVNFGGFAAGFLVAKQSAGEAPGLPRCTRIWPGCMASHVLLYEDDHLVHYDLQRRRRLATRSAVVGLKTALWNHSGSRVALLGKCFRRIKGSFTTF
jgi:hypothetical protein